MTHSFEKLNFKTSLIGRVLGNKEVAEEDVNTISKELELFLKGELFKLPFEK